MYSFIMIKPGRTTCSVAPRRQAGVTIVEVMVSVLIGLILLAAIVQVFINSKQNYAFQVALNEMNESIRFASGQLEYHLRMAGYWGGARNLEVNDSTTWNDYIGICDDNLPDISPGDTRVPSLYFVSRANLAAGSACIARSKVGRRSDTLAVSYADPFPFTESSPNISSGDAYLRVKVGGRAVLAKWPTNGGGDGQFAADATLASSTAADVNNHHFRHHLYFISDCLADTVAVMGAGGPCPAADTDDHPWLRRLLYTRQGYTIENVTPGVEHMTFILLVDQTGNGDTVNFMMADDVRSSTSLGDNPWEAVRAVQYQLLIRTTQRDVNAISDTQTYTLLNGQNALIDTATNEHLYPRRLVTGMVQLRNNVVTL